MLSSIRTSLPSCLQTQAHEQHIIKTAQRIEELNSWVSQDLDPWEFLVHCSGTALLLTFTDGILCALPHTTMPSTDVYTELKRHVNEYETLKLVILSLLSVGVDAPSSTFLINLKACRSSLLRYHCAFRASSNVLSLCQRRKDVFQDLCLEASLRLTQVHDGLHLR